MTSNPYYEPKTVALGEGDGHEEPPSPYATTFHGHKLDPYRVITLYQITDAALQHALKKLLRCGRTHKSQATDVAEAIASLQRWQEMRREDREEA